MVSGSARVRARAGMLAVVTGLAAGCSRSTSGDDAPASTITPSGVVLTDTFECGDSRSSLRCTRGQYCSSISGGVAPLHGQSVPVEFRCNPLPAQCEKAPSCAACFGDPRGMGSCWEGGGGLQWSAAKPSPAPGPPPASSR